MGLTTAQLLALPSGTQAPAKKRLTTAQLLGTAPPTPTPAQSGMVEDFAKSAGSGLLAGAAGTLDAVADRNVPDDMKTQAAAKLAAMPPPKTMEEKAQYDMLAAMAGSKSVPTIAGKSDEVTGGALSYESKTTPGKYAKTVGEFAVGAVGAPGGIVQKGLEVVVPAIASEAAGQATEGSRWEGAARIASALAASIGLGGARAITGKDRAAEELSKAATDPKAASAKIGSEKPTPHLGENVPGSVPDTAELTGDIGLAHTRKSMLMDPEFNRAVGENQGAQNAARQRALDAVVPEADTMALQNQLTAKRAAAESIAARAETEAGAKSALIPAPKHPEDMGGNLRSSIAAAKETAKEAVNQAFAKVDPKRDIVMVATPIKASAKEAVKDYVHGVSAPLGSGEARILDAVNSAPETMPFWHMKALRENVNSAIDDSLGEFGKPTPETRRLQIIKAGIDNAIDKANEHQAAYVPSVGYTGPAPNLTPDTYSALKNANKMYGEYSDKFVSGPVGHALQPSGSDFKNSSASVTKNAFAAGPEGFERTNKFIGTTPDSLAHIKEMAISKFQEIAGDKPITPEMVAKWRKQYDGSIRAIEQHDPNFSKTISDAADSYSTAAELKGQARAQTVLNVHGPDDMRNQVGKYLSGGKGKVKELMALAAGDRSAIDGIKRAAVEHLVEKFSNAGSLGGEKVLSGAKLGKFVSTNSDSIEEMFGKEGLDALKAISSDIERSQIAIENARTRTGGSDTAYMLGKDARNINDKASGMMQSAANTALGTGLGFAHPAIGIAVGAIGWIGKLVGKLGQEKTNRLIKEALLDPKKAKELLDIHAGKVKTIPSWMRTLMTSTVSANERTSRAFGGSVRINHEAEADMLIKAAEVSKARHNKTTEPLLNSPDEHIVKALSVAKEAI